jgi:uncharacterized cupredoxin-like copper-binding protein
MRLRYVALGLLSSATIIAAPASALAHGPRHNHGVTIDATPNPIIAGEGVLIYGQLNGPDSGGQKIYLYHRVNPDHGYTLIGTTTTMSNGFYDFTRVEGVVLSNRSWFVRAPFLPGNVHSRTVREKVSALVSLAASPPVSANGYDTNHAVTFTGHVTPDHAFQRVLLQAQIGATGDDWKTLKHGIIGPGSNYQINYRFRVPGAYEVRVAFPGDPRNIASASDPLSLTVQQTEVPDFLINTSAPLINYGDSATISGTLYLAGTTTPDPGVSVTLWGHTTGQAFHTIGLPTVTGTDGSYSFTVMPGNNTAYKVRTTFNPPPTRHSAVLFEGVRDVVSLNPVPPTSVVGGTVNFTGSVSPDKAGQTIYLERLGADGDWHTVELGTVKFNSTYSFAWTFGNPGTKEFRVRIPGGPENLGGSSAPVTINVALPAISSLPLAS